MLPFPSPSAASIPGFGNRVLTWHEFAFKEPGSVALRGKQLLSEAQTLSLPSSDTKVRSWMSTWWNPPDHAEQLHYPMVSCDHA